MTDDELERCASKLAEVVAQLYDRKWIDHQRQFLLEKESAAMGLEAETYRQQLIADRMRAERRRADSSPGAVTLRKDSTGAFKFDARGIDSTFMRDIVMRVLPWLLALGTAVGWVVREVQSARGR